MKIELAKSAGFCFGVKRAVDTVYDVLKEKKEGPVHTLGPIIHNEQVVSELEDRGVTAVDGIEELEGEKDATLIIRSHGVPREVLQKLEEQEIHYVDATCPFVKKIHDTVHKFSEEGYEILIIGNRTHPEVKGILGWTKDSGTVIENEQEARQYVSRYPEKKKCVVAQTTFNYKKFQYLVEILEEKGYSIYDVNTVCNATAVGGNDSYWRNK